MLREKRTPCASVARGAEGEPQRAGAGEENCKKIVFLYVRSHQLIENTGRAFKNEPETNLKWAQNEAKLDAKRSKNSAIWAKRSEGPQSKDAGFDEPRGGYMKVELEASGLSPDPSPMRGRWPGRRKGGALAPPQAGVPLLLFPRLPGSPSADGLPGRRGRNNQCALYRRG
jgi:hypothetical protein